MPMANPRGPKRRMYTPATMITTKTASASSRWGASTVPSATAAVAGSTSSAVVTRMPLDRGLVDRDVADHRQHRRHDHHGGLLAGEPLERDAPARGRGRSTAARPSPGAAGRGRDRSPWRRCAARPSACATGPATASPRPAVPPGESVTQVSCRFGRAEPSARVLPTRRAASGEAMSSSDLPSASTARKNATSPPTIMMTGAEQVAEEQLDRAASRRRSARRRSPGRSRRSTARWRRTRRWPWPAPPAGRSR